MEEHPLKVARERHNWSQSRLAKKLGVSTRTVIRWEQGHAVPYPIYREQLCQIFETTAVELGLVSDRDDSEVVQDQRASTSYNQSIYDPHLPETLGLPQRLLGRDELLKQIKQQLMGKERQLAITALQGLPGIGKTALAAVIATDPEIQQYFSDGVLWAGLGPDANILNILTRWGSLLGISPNEIVDSTRAADWISALHAAIGQRRFLLVIDDAWNVEDALALKVGGPYCAHLLTTRLSAVSYVCAVETTVVVPELAEEDGLTLLAHLVPQIVEQEPEAARTLVQAVGGLPLALKLLGHYLASQVYTGQLRRVQTALERLRDGEQRLRLTQPLPPYEHPVGLSGDYSLSLQATIGLSVQWLSKEAQRALAALALFPAKPASFSEDAAVVVMGAEVELLDVLWDAGLLESSGSGRYTLHQTIADYERLQAPDTAAQLRLITYMVEYTQVHERDFAALELEVNNVLNALGLAQQCGEYSLFLQGILKFARFMQAYGLYTQADRYLQQALEMARLREDRQGEATILMHLAAFAEPRGEYAQAELYGPQGLALADELALHDLECDLLSTLGVVATERGDIVQADLYFARGLDVARQLADQERISRLLGQYSRVITLQGDYSRAEQLCKEGIALAQQQQDRRLVSRLFSTWGMIFSRQGLWVQAEEKGLQSLLYARQSGHREGIAGVLLNLSGVYHYMGNGVAAEQCLQEGLEIARQIGHRRLINWLLTNLAAELQRRGAYVQAELHLYEALENVQKMGEQEIVATVLCNLGASISLQGDYERANEYFKRSVVLARQGQAPWELGSILSELGEHHLRHQQIESAASVFQEILALNEPVVYSEQMVQMARYGIARIAALRGDVVQARRLGQEVLNALRAVQQYQAAEVEQWLAALPDEGEEHSTSDA